MKFPSLFLPILFMAAPTFSQNPADVKPISPDQKVMLDCDQRIFYEIFIRYSWLYGYAGK